MKFEQLTRIFEKCIWEYDFDFPSFFDLYYRDRRLGDFTADADFAENIPPYQFDLTTGSQTVFLYENQDIIILAMSRYFKIELVKQKFHGGE